MQPDYPKTTIHMFQDFSDFLENSTISLCILLYERHNFYLQSPFDIINIELSSISIASNAYWTP